MPILGKTRNVSIYPVRYTGFVNGTDKPSDIVKSSTRNTARSRITFGDISATVTDEKYAGTRKTNTDTIGSPIWMGRGIFPLTC